MLAILEYPNPKLSEVSSSITQFDTILQSRAIQMIETMRSAKGVGLAAIQVGWPIRMLVMECKGAPLDVMVICNPVIIEKSGSANLQEGCLSVPGFHETLERAAKVTARWQDEYGQEQEGIFEDLAAVCLQHEMDHLEGHLFFEKLSPLKSSRIKTKILKKKNSVFNLKKVFNKTN